MDEYSKLTCKPMIYNLALSESEWKKYIYCSLASNGCTPTEQSHLKHKFLKPKHAIKYTDIIIMSKARSHMEDKLWGESLQSLHDRKDWGRCYGEMLVTWHHSPTLRADHSRWPDGRPRHRRALEAIGASLTVRERRTRSPSCQPYLTTLWCCVLTELLYLLVINL